MTLHPEIAKVLASLPAPDGSPLDPVAMRAAEAAHLAPVEARPQVHEVQDVLASTPLGEVPVRIYTPAQAESYGLLVYIHGGAFFLGSLDTHDHVARDLARATGYKVILVGYRLAPENAFPAGLQDCYGVLRWAVGQGDALAWDGTNLALAGDSSGATFVAAVVGMAKDDGFNHVTAQLLFYPSLDLDFDEECYASLRENATGYGMETPALKPFNAFYVNSGADPDDPRVSPIKRADLTGFPPTLIITAQYDPLRDEGELYGQKLRDAGVDVQVSRYAGANHGFMANFAWVPEFQRAYQESAEFLRRLAER